MSIFVPLLCMTSTNTNMVLSFNIFPIDIPNRYSHRYSLGPMVYHHSHLNSSGFRHQKVTIFDPQRLQRLGLRLQTQRLRAAAIAAAADEVADRRATGVTRLKGSHGSWKPQSFSLRWVGDVKEWCIPPQFVEIYGVIMGPIDGFTNKQWCS